MKNDPRLWGLSHSGQSDRLTRHPKNQRPAHLLLPAPSTSSFNFNQPLSVCGDCHDPPPLQVVPTG